MSSNGKAGNGRGNNRRRHRKRTGEGEAWQKGNPGQANGAYYRPDNPNRGNFPKRNGENAREERIGFIERPRWIPPKLNTEPLPVSICPWCGKPIRDMSSAIADKDTGVPVHFDCVTARIAFGEKLEKGEAVAYIGGGRFGIISFGGGGFTQNKTEHGDFTIKKIIEWESKDKRAEWRAVICDHFSVT